MCIAFPVEKKRNENPLLIELIVPKNETIKTWDSNVMVQIVRLLAQEQLHTIKVIAYFRTIKRKIPN